jgi:pimeloyl-[acyl-carrier protein] methyl ester esterase
MEHPTPSQQTLENSLQLLSSSDLRTKLALIKQPFLRLYGENDSLVPKGVMPLVKAIAPSSKQHSFSNASHAPFISHPDDFYQVIREWVAEHYIY